MDFPFNRYAEFIQEFIYREGWNELREVQIQAAKVLTLISGNLNLSNQYPIYDKLFYLIIG